MTRATAGSSAGAGATVDDGWLLAVFSRAGVASGDKRHTLRSRLTWLGFGTVAAGVWIAPGHLDDEAADVLGRRGLAGYVDLFRGDYLAFGDLRDSVAARGGTWTRCTAATTSSSTARSRCGSGVAAAPAPRRGGPSPTTSGC